jgi:hypothetical protein
MGLRTDEIDSLRLVVGQFLPETATVTRTGATYPCRVSKSRGRVWRPTGMPRYAGIPFWQITFPVVGSDIQTGDEITVAGMGVYTVTYTDSPESYNVSIIAWCLHTKDLNGNHLWPVITTDTVTFSKDTHVPVITTAPVRVRIYPVHESWNLQQFWTDYQWAIDYPVGLRYPNPYQTLPIGVNDTIHWTRDGKNLTFKLEHPMTNNDPVMPVVTALFKELF